MKEPRILLAVCTYCPREDEAPLKTGIGEDMTVTTRLQTLYNLIAMYNGVDPGMALSTIVLVDNDSTNERWKQFHQNLHHKKLQSGSLMISYTRPNRGLSPGAWDFAYQLFPDFDYYVFHEADYFFYAPGWLKYLHDKFIEQDPIIDRCSFVGPANKFGKTHLDSNFLFAPRHVLEDICNVNNDQLAYYNYTGPVRYHDEHHLKHCNIGEKSFTGIACRRNEEFGRLPQYDFYNVLVDQSRQFMDWNGLIMFNEYAPNPPIIYPAEHGPKVEWMNQDVQKICRKFKIGDLR